MVAEFCMNPRGIEIPPRDGVGGLKKFEKSSRPQKSPEISHNLPKHAEIRDGAENLHEMRGLGTPNGVLGWGISLTHTVYVAYAFQSALILSGVSTFHALTV